MGIRSIGRRARFLVCLLLCVLLPLCGIAENASGTESATPKDWVAFLLICNEGMNNRGGNAGNTEMVVGMNPREGKIRLMMFSWETFIRYPGYDMPQRMDLPYRNSGPEETLRIFNLNFGMDIVHFLSLNYLNLASLIDAYGGVEADVSRAERNALNAMVASKKENITAQADQGLISQMLVELLADEYYLSEYGPGTRLNGLQAVGYGWLQYDSIYNCCLREVQIIADLFERVAQRIIEKAVFYTEVTGYPEDTRGRRALNLDKLTQSDEEFLYQLVAPIFQMSYNNMTKDEIIGITATLARVAYTAMRQGVDIFEVLEYRVMPLEVTAPYDYVAGTRGHLVDYEANSAAIRSFLFGEGE